MEQARSRRSVPYDVTAVQLVEHLVGVRVRVGVRVGVRVRAGVRVRVGVRVGVRVRVRVRVGRCRACLLLVHMHDAI